MTVTRTSRAIARGLRHHPLLLLLHTALLLLIGTAGIWRGAQVVRPTSESPADLFMQSIATEDGTRVESAVPVAAATVAA